MAKLPIIVASGGINTAGRTSHRHAHNRLVFDSLDQAKRDETARALTAMMDAQDVDEVLDGTLVRKIERVFTLIPLLFRRITGSALMMCTESST